MTDIEFNRARQLSDEVDAINGKIEIISLGISSGKKVYLQIYYGEGFYFTPDELQGILEYLKQSAKQKQAELERILKN